MFLNRKYRLILFGVCTIKSKHTKHIFLRAESNEKEPFFQPIRNENEGVSETYNYEQIRRQALADEIRSNDYESIN
jgi:hypothetical protein